MKLKHFLLFFSLLGIVFMPRDTFASNNASIKKSSATSDFVDQVFTFDAKLAPIKLEYVDFKINRNRTADEWGKDIGQYNFKLFGCKRAERNVVLNEGRTMRRDMKFDNVFFEELNELFPVLVRKDNPYFPYSLGASRPDLLPGYVITAEIKDLFINVCDQYDWRTRTYSQLRSGSSEIKVLWRVMTPFNRKLYWEGVTKGYAEVQTPVRDGEVRLIEKAFADALVRIIGMPDFLQTVRKVPDVKELELAKAEFDALAYEHKRYKKLMSSYRRKRTVFYTERSREKILEDLERMDVLSRDLTGDLEQQNQRALEDLKYVENLKNKQMSDEALLQEIESQKKSQKISQKESDENLDKLKSMLAEKGLSDEEIQSILKDSSLSDEDIRKMLQGRGLTDSEMASIIASRSLGGEDVKNGVLARGLKEKAETKGQFAKLLSEAPLENGIMARLLPNIPLVKYFDSSLLPQDLERENQKYGFIVSKVDGWITINNQKPFRYLSPIRIYRIRSSIVAVTKEKEVGSGLIIAPSLVLTNYEITKDATYVNTEFLDGRVASSMVLRANKDKDVALLYMPPTEFDKYNWPVPLRLDLPEVGEKFYAIGTPMRGGFEGAMEQGKVAGYRFSDNGVDILTNTNVQSVTLGGALVDENGNAIGLAHAGKNLVDSRDGFIPIGDAFDALKVRIQDREVDETPTEKAIRLRDEHNRENYIK